MDKIKSILKNYEVKLIQKIVKTNLIWMRQKNLRHQKGLKMS